MKLWNGRGEMLIEYKKRTGKIANKIVWIKLNSLTLNDINFTKIFPYYTSITKAKQKNHIQIS